MSFLDPIRLWLLLVLPALLVAYLFLQQRNKVYAARLASAELFNSVVPRRAGWRRHVSAFLMLLTLGLFITAFARPTAPTEVPVERATVIVAVDVSLSMEADDVDPTRLVAAKVAASRFIEELPSSLNVGVVSFAGTASVLVSPTTDRVLAMRAIENLELDESTAIGEAIFTSIDALKSVPAYESGELPPARIVLLSDGHTTVGRSDAEATEAARAAQVPVSTIAFGTPGGVIVYDDPATEFVEREVVPVPVGDENLEAIAEETGGNYFSATSLDELDAVYADIGSAIGYTTVNREITDWFVGAGLAMLIAAVAASLVWFQRLI